MKTNFLFGLIAAAAIATTALATSASASCYTCGPQTPQNTNVTYTGEFGATGGGDIENVGTANGKYTSGLSLSTKWAEVGGNSASNTDGYNAANGYVGVGLTTKGYTAAATMGHGPLVVGTTESVMAGAGGSTYAQTTKTYGN